MNKTWMSGYAINNKWFRLGFSGLLAFGLALGLLFIPLAMSSNSQSFTPARPFMDTLPFGVSLVYAQGGVTVTKVAEPAAVRAGEAITYTLTFTNQTGGPLGPGSVVIWEKSPTNTVLNCASVQSPSGWGLVSPGCTDDEIIWGLVSSSIADGASVDFLVAVNVDDPLPPISEILNDRYFVATGEPVYGPPVTTTVIAPGWAITKTPSSNPTTPGQYLTYLITISNSGTAATTGSYTITDQLPNDTYYVSGSASPAANFDGSALTWVLSPPTYTVAAGAARSVSFVVTTSNVLTDGLLLVNQDYEVSGGGVYTPTAGQPVTVTVDSDVTLQIGKIASSNVLTVGYPLTYTLTITNASSNGPALNVVVTDTLPAFFIYQSAGFVGGVPGSVITNGGNPIVWDLDNPLPPNSFVQLTVTGQVSTTLPNPPTLTNQYRVTADNATMASGSIDVTVQPDEPKNLTVVAASTSLKICETTVATTTLTDQFGNPLSGKSVDLTILAGLVPPAGTATISPDPGTTNGNGFFTSTLQATGAGNIRILGEYGIVSNFPPPQTINISDQAIPTNLTLTALPNPLATGGAAAVATATLDYCRADLKAGKSITFTLSNTGLAAFPGDVDTVYDTTDSNGNATATLASKNISGTLTITATGEGLTRTMTLPIHTPALTVTKTAAPANQIGPGESIAYTVRVDNVGDVAASEVRLTDTLPLPVSYVTLISSTNSAPGVINGPVINGNVVAVSTAKLEPNTSLTATIYVTVTATLSGAILENQASAGSSASPLQTSNWVRHTVITGPVSTGSKTYLPLILKHAP
ncbi:MAG: DUF11 domain-containing protein [Anaerolineae bacterium]|nr:DUF11 domain-containing protein [Anaerolineae bacterium]